jgi:hypothetical protein
MLSLPSLKTPAGKAGASLPRDAKLPVFEEDWQGHAFAMVMALYQNGHYDWAQWDDYLGPQIKSPAYYGESQPEEPPIAGGSNRNAFLAACDEDGANYYHYWLAAMEELLHDIGLVSKDELEARVHDISQAERLPPRFKAGDRVRIVEQESHGHSHIPHYLRDLAGTVESDRGIYVFPEAVPARDGHHHPDEALYQHVFAVGFEASEIWPESRHTLNFTFWDHQLIDA